MHTRQLYLFVHAHRKPILAKHTIAEYGLDEPLVFVHRDLGADDDTDAMAAVRAVAVRTRGKPLAFAWLDK
jgi:hypothetical protein